MRSLTELLHPLNVDEFLEKNWAEQAIVISGAGSRSFEHLFSWETLNYLLNYHELKYPDIRLAIDGKVLAENESKDLRKQCQEGATLILNQVHKLVPELSEFTAELTHDLGYSTQVNAYCSWSEKQGFSVHYDTHEVFILQVYGSKQWYVFADTIKYPLPEQKFSSFTPPEEEPYLTCTLKPGDVLYIPRGHWHYAEALEEPSLHLTLGVHSKTGIDFLEWVVSELRQQEIWRKSLPLRFEREAVNHQLILFNQEFHRYLSSHDFGTAYLNYLDSLGRPSYSFPHQAGFNVFQQGIETQFVSPKFQRVQILELEDRTGYKIIASSKEVSLRGVPKNTIQALFSGEPFTGKDVLEWLPDFDWDIDIAPTLFHLVTEGVLFINE